MASSHVGVLTSSEPVNGKTIRSGRTPQLDAPNPLVTCSQHAIKLSYLQRDRVGS